MDSFKKILLEFITSIKKNKKEKSKEVASKSPAKKTYSSKSSNKVKKIFNILLTSSIVHIISLKINNDLYLTLFLIFNNGIA